MRPLPVLRSRPALYLAASYLAALLLIAACEHPTAVRPTPGAPLEQRNYPTPAIDSITPDSAFANEPPFTVTVSGRGFVSSSVVLVDSVPRPTTYVSKNVLRFTVTDEDLTWSRVYQVQVSNPDPGGASAAVPLVVQAGVPSISRLQHDPIMAGTVPPPVRVIGGIYVRNSVVHVNGAARPTRYIDPWTLEVQPEPSDVQTGGFISMRVFNPAPGGGWSIEVGLFVSNPIPELLHLQSQSFTVLQYPTGNPHLIVVHGRNFHPDAEVLWNGYSLATEVLSPTRVQAWLPDDPYVPGEAQVQVRNQYSDGPSQPLTAILRPRPDDAVPEVRRATVHARDLAWDPHRNVFYLSIRAGAPPTHGDFSYENSVAVLDPATMNITDVTYIGRGVGRVALSHDGAYLNVGVDSIYAIRRVDMSVFYGLKQWYLPEGHVAGEMEAIPGMPTSVIVSRQRVAPSAYVDAVTAYDDGEPRPTPHYGDADTPAGRFAYMSSPDTLYGYNHLHGRFDFYTLLLDGAGVHRLKATRGLLSGADTRIVAAAGRIYGTDGSIVDAERHARIASFNRTSYAMLVDAALGRAFLLVDGGIEVWDINRFQQLATVPVAALAFEPPSTSLQRLVRSGPDQLAFLDQDEVVLVRSPWFGPN